MMNYIIKVLNGECEQDIKNWLNENVQPIDYLIIRYGHTEYRGSIDHIKFEKKEDWLFFKLEFDGKYLSDANFVAGRHNGVQFVRELGLF